MTNTPIVGRIYHVVDKTTGETVKVGSTIQTLCRRFGTEYRKKFPNHFLKEVRIIQSNEFDWYEKGDSYCPFLWHLVTIEHLEMLRVGTYRNGLNSNKQSPLDQKFSGFDGSEYGRIGALAVSRETRVRGGITTGRMNAESGFMSRLGKSMSYEDRVKNCSLGGQKRVESGFFSSEHQSKVGRISGKISGRKNAESGHCARIANLGGLVGGPKGGRKSFERKVGVFSPDYDKGKGGRVGGKIGAPIANHNRWHVRRGLISNSCSLCKVEQSVHTSTNDSMGSNIY